MLDAESFRKRHEFMMQQHAIDMRRSWMRSVTVIALMALIILLSLMVLVNPAVVGAERAALDPHLVFAIVVYTAAMLVLILEHALVLRSRERAIRTSIRMTQLAFDLGRLIGKRQV